jgi:hypothetical protein
VAADASTPPTLQKFSSAYPVNPAVIARHSNRGRNGSSLEIERENLPEKENIMLSKAIKLVAALGLIAAIGTTAAFAGPCSCSRGAGGTTYCNCR